MKRSQTLIGFLGVWLLTIAYGSTCIAEEVQERSCDPRTESQDCSLGIDDFMPAEIDSLYHPEDCNIDPFRPCALWVATDEDSRYLITCSTEDGFPSQANLERLLRAVIPDGLQRAPIALNPSQRSEISEPITIPVKSALGSGQVQIIKSPTRLLLVWMPDREGNGSFVRVDVTLIDTPPPNEMREIGVANNPDVIDQDSRGYLWFSGWQNEIYRIDPMTDIPEAMTGSSATGTPDGLVVDSSDLVWYGAYEGRYMGLLSSELPLTRYDMPYTPSNPAIPCEAPDGNIWITDHVANRITEFNPTMKMWQRSLVMPVPSAWVVQCKPDSQQLALWLTMYNARSLGRLDLTTDVIDRYIVPCQPAFDAVDSNNKIWATCWDSGNLIQLDPATLTGIEYAIPNRSQAGGISITPDGKIAFTQNALGRVGILDPDSLEFYYYQFPSRPGFKDGLLVDRSGTIWAPSPGGRLVGKIIPGSP